MAAVANPTYTSILMEVDVNRPAAEVWKRVGKFCDIGEWMGFPARSPPARTARVGTVRNIGREVLVGKTDLSYTYTQPVTAGQPYILYHGTLEAKPVTATTSKLLYTLMWDNSTCADDAAAKQDKNQRRQMFQTALNNMKILAEGGTLPAGRAGGPGGCAAPRGAGGAGGPGVVVGGCLDGWPVVRALPAVHGRSKQFGSAAARSPGNAGASLDEFQVRETKSPRLSSRGLLLIAAGYRLTADQQARSAARGAGAGSPGRPASPRSHPCP